MSKAMPNNRMNNAKNQTKQIKVETNYNKLRDKSRYLIAQAIGEFLANEVLTDTKPKSLALGSVKTRIKT